VNCPHIVLRKCEKGQDKDFCSWISRVLSLLFNILLNILSRAIKQEKEIQGIKIEKEKIKVCLFTGGMILNTGNIKESS
jgi:hypothetical protein